MIIRYISLFDYNESLSILLLHYRKEKEIKQINSMPNFNLILTLRFI